MTFEEGQQESQEENQQEPDLIDCSTTFFTHHSRAREREQERKVGITFHWRQDAWIINNFFWLNLVIIITRLLSFYEKEGDLGIKSVKKLKKMYNHRIPWG